MISGVTVCLVAVDLFAAGAGNVLDQMVALIIDAQSGLVDVDGDDLAGIAQPDLDALADDLGAATAGHRALHPGGTLVQQRSGTGVRAPWRRGRVGRD